MEMKDTSLPFFSCDHLLSFFSCEHLPDHLREISAPCRDLAVKMNSSLDLSEELLIGLRKLLEAKDCFVRAKLLMVKENEER